MSNAQTWCSDALHSLLGCSDSALASYLTSIASSASSHKKILSVLKEGDVNPIKGSGQAEKDRILESFARDLFAKCQGGTRKRKGNNDKLTSRSEKKKSNADWVKSAAAYDLVNDFDDDPQESLAVVSRATASTTSSDKPIKEIRIKSKSHKRSKKDKNKAPKDEDDLDEDDINNRDTSSRSKSKKSKSSQKDGRKKSRRRVHLSDSSDDEDHGIDVRKKYEYEKEQRRVDREKRKTKGSGSDSDDNDEEVNLEDLSPEERAEREREQDRKERDEFAKRLLERDSKKNAPKDPDTAKEKVKKRVEMEQKLARGEEVVDEVTGSKISLKSLREESRRAYLKQRTERELKLLEQELEDEEDMFDGEELTEAEKKRIQLRKQILRMARDDKAKKERDEEDGFYRLPDEYEDQEGRTKAEKENALLKSRYVEDKVEKTEQQLWEEAQVQKAMPLKKKGKVDGQKQYDLVFDDKIDFVMTDSRKGYDKRKKGKLSKRRGKDESDVSDESDESNVSSEDEKSVEESKAMTAHQKILAGRKKLPVYAYRDEFLSAVKDHQVLILVGETGMYSTYLHAHHGSVYVGSWLTSPFNLNLFFISGSGKTTQIPQFLHEIGYSKLGKICCTQPRRVAAMSVAARVATEMNVKVGHEVGYSIRFENCTSKKTLIQYMTDGFLIREFLTEPDLASYSCLIIDEAHERTLHTDILFGLVKDIIRFRSDLKLIISSATLDAEKYSKYFDDASIFMIPVSMIYGTLLFSCFHAIIKQLTY